MENSVKLRAMRYILQEGIPYFEAMPRQLVESLNSFFFERMFVDDVELLGDLALNVMDPHADEMDRMELNRILKTFSVVNGFHDVLATERFVESTRLLIELAGDLREVVEASQFQEFTRFVEFLVVSFIDPMFTLLSHEEYSDEVIVYHLSEVFD